jgi:hypothetical protein
MVMKWKYYAEVTKKQVVKLFLIPIEIYHSSKQQFLLTHGYTILQDREKKLD